MQSDSQPASNSDRPPPDGLVNLIGSAIALLTLLLPLLAIAYYSPSTVENLPPPSYNTEALP
jgi:hypothetical protein